VFEGCKIGQKPAIEITAENVFAILYIKSIPQRLKGHKDKEGNLIFTFVLLVPLWERHGKVI
jgi:hypothetical protein